MPDCVNVEVRDALPDLLHDRLPVVERERVMAHVSTCADCAAELALLRVARGAITAAVPTVDAAALARAVRARLAAAEQGPARDARSLRPRWATEPGGTRARWASRSLGRLRAAAAVVLLAAGVGGVLVARGSRDGGPAGPPDRVATAVRLDSGNAPATQVAVESAIDDRRADSSRLRGTGPSRVDPALGSTFDDLTDAELAAIVEAMTGADAGLPDAELVAPPVVVDTTEEI